MQALFLFVTSTIITPLCMIFFPSLTPFFTIFVNITKVYANFI